MPWWRVSGFLIVVGARRGELASGFAHFSEARAGAHQSVDERGGRRAARGCRDQTGVTITGERSTMSNRLHRWPVDTLHIQKFGPLMPYLRASSRKSSEKPALLTKTRSRSERRRPLGRSTQRRQCEICRSSGNKNPGFHRHQSRHLSSLVMKTAPSGNFTCAFPRDRFAYDGKDLLPLEPNRIPRLPPPHLRHPRNHRSHPHSTGLGAYW